MTTMNKITLKQVRPGSTIMVSGAWGTEPPVQATVVEVLKDIKNGRPGIDYRTQSSTYTNWAYLDQVTEIIKF